MVTEHARVRRSHAAARNPPADLAVVTAVWRDRERRPGALIHYFHKVAKHRIRQVTGDLAMRRMHELFDSYAVVARDGAVVTVRLPPSTHKTTIESILGALFHRCSDFA